MAKRNIAKGKNKKKRQARRQREIQENFIADKEELAAKQEAEKQEQEKVKAKVVEARKKEVEKKENPGFFTRCVDYVKSTWGELKRTQWLDAAIKQQAQYLLLSLYLLD